MRKPVCHHCGKPATRQSDVSDRLLCDDCNPCWCFWCAGAVGQHGEEAKALYMQQVEDARARMKAKESEGS